MDWDSRDGKAFFDYFLGKINFLSYAYKFYPDTIKVYRTKHGAHVYVRVERIDGKPISFEEQLLLQVILGDDIRRCMYSLVEGENILFSVKDKYEAINAVDFETVLIKAAKKAIEENKGKKLHKFEVFL
jgi:hypothetical protein